ncbi:ABC transporter ATP-binding protein [Halovivax limisalsi]|uniref:ABC transporter ATP-binding protein n=1 Tax=Halovivax limisalsi TaxID=1453760 RepID=UPI001FFD1202|nr:ABC transporter ATP-binding protein [Halovivax limisalsi]
MTELRLEGVTKRYGAGPKSGSGGDSGTGAGGTVADADSGTLALRNVDLTIRDGEFFTLVGPSGCGKTTTLRTIAGFEDPTSGRVTFDGGDVSGLAPEGRDVGVVFQSYALFPHMTVGENVGYGLRFRDPPAGTSREERVAELLSLVDLDGLGDREPDQLSGGQQQRVALARALAPEPSLLLLDEPMSALDARLRESLRRQVKHIQSDLGITTVYVTHDQAEALAISDRLAVMRDGRIEQIGTPREVYRTPATRFVASFVGDNTVFDGEIVDGHIQGSSPAGTEVAVGDRTFELADVPANADRVTFCVRSDALSPSVDRNQLRITVETTEFLGDRVRVHGRWDGRSIVVTLDDWVEYGRTGDDETVGEARNAGDELLIGFEPTDAHVIDRE